MYDIIIDNVSASSHDLFIVSRVDIPAPEKNIQAISILGRHGDLIKEYGFLDRTITVNFNFKIRSSEDSMPKKIREINSWLINAKTITFTDDKEVYYKVKAVNIGDIVRDLRVLGSFNITFTIEPFSYLATSFPIKLTAGTKLTNLGTYESEPYIKITGSGNVTLNINNKELQLKAVDGYIEIDSEAKETHKNYESMNHKKVGDYPVFQVGQNSISWTGTVTSVEIEPRWRCL